MKRLRTRRWVIALGIAAILFVVAFTQWSAAISRNRAVGDEPHHIAANLYYVGAVDMAAFLLTGPEGHILIDGGWPESAPAIMASIAKAGFNIGDVKVLVNTHAHSDHAGGLRALQEASGAKLWVSEGDAALMEAGGRGDVALGPLRYIGYTIGDLRFKAPRVDHRFKDGEVIRVGPLAITAHVTAGHTRGCTSWSIPVRDGERDLLAVNICSLTLFPFVSLVEPEAYPGIRADFERSFATLRGLPADIFLGAHGTFFGLARKRRESASSIDPVAPFIDRAGYMAFIDRAEQDFREALAAQQK